MALLCSHFFFLIMGDNDFFFSLLCASATQFQLFDQLSKRTSHKNSFDIDLKLDLLLKAKQKSPKDKFVWAVLPIPN